jgi:undecaprenyl-diphosphatase
MDQKLLFLINRVWTNPVLDRTMAALSSFDFWVPVLILAALAVAVWGGFKARAFLVAALLSAGLADGAIGNPLKRLVDRPRPAQAIGGVRQVDLVKAHPRLLALARPAVVHVSEVPQPVAGGRSFPSSHTANTMAAALVAFLFYPRRGWAAILFALLVAYSRLYTGSHWPSDVVASIFLGAGVGLLTATGLEMAWRWRAPFWWPGFFRLHPSLLSA